MPTNTALLLEQHAVRVKGNGTIDSPLVLRLRKGRTPHGIKTDFALLRRIQRLRTGRKKAGVLLPVKITVERRYVTIMPNGNASKNGGSGRFWMRVAEVMNARRRTAPPTKTTVLRALSKTLAGSLQKQ